MWLDYLAGTSLAHEALIKSEKTDWLIVGAGITGLCAAHALAQMHPQARIVIVDRQRAAQGASARNSGFSVAHENPSDAELIGNRGFADFEVDTFISVAASQEVRQRIERHSIDCEYRDSGYFFAVNDPRKLAHVEATLKTLQAVGGFCSFSARPCAGQNLGYRALSFGYLVRQR